MVADWLSCSVSGSPVLLPLCALLPLPCTLAPAACRVSAGALPPWSLLLTRPRVLQFYAWPPFRAADVADLFDVDAVDAANGETHLGCEDLGNRLHSLDVLKKEHLSVLISLGPLGWCTEVQ